MNCLSINFGLRGLCRLGALSSHYYYSQVVTSNSKVHSKAHGDQQSAMRSGKPIKLRFTLPGASLHSQTAGPCQLAELQDSCNGQENGCTCKISPSWWPTLGFFCGGENVRKASQTHPGIKHTFTSAPRAPGGIALIGRKSGQRREIKKRRRKIYAQDP